MVFKGGTSLSKVFGLIDRFSEDIDLVLDWRLLGYDQAGANDPFQATPSKSKQSRYNLEMNAKLLRTSTRCSLNSTNFSHPSSGVVARIDEVDPHTVNVFYPAAFAAEYIRPAVRLEIGPLASWVPSSSHSIKAYAAQAFPEAFSNPVFQVIAIYAERTFWTSNHWLSRARLSSSFWAKAMSNKVRCRLGASLPTCELVSAEVLESSKQLTLR